MTIRTALAPLIPSRVFSRLQQLKAEIAIRNYTPRDVEHTYGQHRLSVHLHDPLAAAWYDRDWKRPAEFALLEASRLTSGALVFDIGAHQCVMAMLLAKDVGPQGHVIAVEPTPFNVQIGRINLQANRVDNVTIVESMLGSSNRGGIISFQLNAVAQPGQAFGREVRSITLDDLIDEFGVPAVIYLDIEGFEAEILGTADHLLGTPIDWCVELHGDEVLRRFGASNGAIVRKYLSNGFRVTIITEQQAIFQVDRHQCVPSGRCHIVAVKACNAAFTHS